MLAAQEPAVQNVFLKPQGTTESSALSLQSMLCIQGATLRGTYVYRVAGERSQPPMGELNGHGLPHMIQRGSPATPLILAQIGN